MPILTGPLSANTALAELIIGVGAVHAAALVRAGRPVPPALVVRALIDTGAKRTCVDARVIAALDVLSTDVRHVRTVATGPMPLVTRVFNLAIMGGPASAVINPELAVLEANLAHHGIDCLLGRDALQSCVLVYDGPARRFSLAF